MTPIKRLMILRQAVNSADVDDMLFKLAAENKLDMILRYLDTTLSVADLVALAGIAGGVTAPVAGIASRVIGIAAAAVDVAQAVVCLTRQDWSCVAENLITAVISGLIDNTMAKAAGLGVGAMKNSAVMVFLIDAIIIAVDAVYSRFSDAESVSEKDGITAALKDRNHYIKVTNKLRGTKPTGWIDYPTSENPNEVKPSSADIAKQKEFDEWGRAKSPATKQTGSACNPPATTPISSKFTIAGNTIEYRSGSNVQSGPGMIEDSVVIAATSLAPGIKLKDSDWKICRVDRDAEGEPELVVLSSVTDPSKYLFVKHKV